MSKIIEPVEALPTRKYGARGVDWAAVCEAVEAEGARSDRWCMVGVFTPSVATHIRSGKYPSVDPERFEVTTQKDPDHPGKSVFYMRLRK